MNLKLTTALIFALMFTFSCDNEFTGGGDGGIGKRFSGAGGDGKGDGNTPDVGEGGDGIGTGNGNNGGLDNGAGNNGGIDDGEGGNLPGGGLDGGGGVDTRNYSPMTVEVLRRDRSIFDDHDHSHVTLAYQVIGGKRVESGVIGESGDTFTIPRGCPPSGSVNAVIQFQTENGARVSPNKNNTVGGPIGYRLGPSQLLVGYENEAVNNPRETAYHNNDDLVLRFTCGTGAQLIINNLCIDQRIPANGMDLVNDDITYDNDEPPRGHGAPARLCNGV